MEDAHNLYKSNIKIRMLDKKVSNMVILFFFGHKLVAVFLKRTNKNRRHGLYRTIKVIPHRSFLHPSGFLERQKGGRVGREGELF